MTRRNLLTGLLAAPELDAGIRRIPVSWQSIPGVSGKWICSTPMRQDIKRSLQFAIEEMAVKTLGAVDQDDATILFNEETARQVKISQEFVTHSRSDLYKKGTLYGIPMAVSEDVPFGTAAVVFGDDPANPSPDRIILLEGVA